MGTGPPARNPRPQAPGPWTPDWPRQWCGLAPYCTHSVGPCGTLWDPDVDPGCPSLCTKPVQLLVEFPQAYRHEGQPCGLGSRLGVMGAPPLPHATEERQTVGCSASAQSRRLAWEDHVGDKSGPHR